MYDVLYSVLKYARCMPDDLNMCVYACVCTYVNLHVMTHKLVDELFD